MRKVKRKYTRKEVGQSPPDAVGIVIQPPISDSEISQNSGIGGQSGSKIPFGFQDLPLSVRMQVETALEMRKRLRLPDDSKERKERAVIYFRGDRPR
mgnify:FL=1